MKGACQSHTARSPFVGPAAARVRWTWAPESGSCGDAPVVIDAAGTIYVAPGSQLYAVAPDGRTKWSYPVQTSQTAPVIGADGTIYYAGSDNFVALTRDGLERFASGAASAWQNFYGSPAIGADSTLYFTNIEHELVAVSGAGAKQWSLTDNTITHSSPAIGEDGTLYTSTSSHSLLAVGRDGALRWQAVGHGGTMGEPVVRADGTVYMVDASRLVAYRPDGHEAWHFDGATSGGTPALGIDGTVYLGADTGSAGSYKFCAVRADGTLAWSYDTDGIFTAQPAIGGDGTIYAGSRGGTLYAWRTDGTLAWSYAVGTPMIHTAPAIGEDGTLYLCADKLYAFDP